MTCIKLLDGVFQTSAVSASPNEALPDFLSVSTFACAGISPAGDDEDSEIALAMAIVAVAAIRGGRRGLTLLDAVEHSIDPGRLRHVFRTITPAALRRALAKLADGD